MQKLYGTSQKWDFFRKQNSETETFFSIKLKSSKKKESLQDGGYDTKFCYQRLPWIPFKVI